MEVYGPAKTRNIHRILIDPNNPDIVYAGVMGNPLQSMRKEDYIKPPMGGDS